MSLGAEMGTGIFAGQNIPAHTFIGVYAGEFLTGKEGDERGECVVFLHFRRGPRSH